MSLKLDLILRMVVIATTCLFLAAAYVLYQTDRETRREAGETADSIGRQLEVQLHRVASGFDHPDRFPDLNLWAETGFGAGLCIRFTRPDGTVIRNFCRGDEPHAGPPWFQRLYRWLFLPGDEIARAVTFRGEHHGLVSVIASEGTQITRGWRDVRGLFGLTVALLLALGALTYAAISRTLRPAKTVVAGLQRMKNGELSTRLPPSEITEWQNITEAINRLAGSLQQTLAERAELALKLMNVQEEERRYLARELHDEFGQCLASINATSTSIRQTAENVCPELVRECRNITCVSDHMMDLLRGMLLRLRPSEIDELGLTVCLQRLVAGWDARCRERTRFSLTILGEVDRLPEPITANLYRIVQECLTNASKHAAASSVSVRIERDTTASPGAVSVAVEDDGVADTTAFAKGSGVGLLGIRERVTALGGHMSLQAGAPAGLAVHIHIPLPATSASP